MPGMGIPIACLTILRMNNTSNNAKTYQNHDCNSPHQCNGQLACPHMPCTCAQNWYCPVQKNVHDLESLLLIIASYKWVLPLSLVPESAVHHIDKGHALQALDWWQAIDESSWRSARDSHCCAAHQGTCTFKWSVGTSIAGLWKSHGMPSNILGDSVSNLQPHVQPPAWLTFGSHDDICKW